jgi:hypothetical protein
MKIILFPSPTTPSTPYSAAKIDDKTIFPPASVFHLPPFPELYLARLALLRAHPYPLEDCLFYLLINAP